MFAPFRTLSSNIDRSTVLLLMYFEGGSHHPIGHFSVDD